MKSNQNTNKAPKRKLNLRQKKHLLLEWFLDENESSIRTFCVDVKGVPHARPFLRNAAHELDLFSLRQQRKEQGEDGDEVVALRIEHFRPKNRDGRKLDGEGGRRGPAESKPPTREGKKTMQEIKSLITDWFNDENMEPLHSFLKQRDSLTLKSRILRLINQNGLRNLRKKRDYSEAKELALSKIELLGTCDCYGSPTTDMKKEERRRNRHNAKKVAIESSKDAMKEI